MKLHEHFKNALSYSAGIREWVDKSLPYGPLNYTFAMNFAIADWLGEKNVEDTYKKIKESWLGDYKAFTEAVVALNMLSWANDALRKQGIEGREKFIKLYADLYYRARDDFYSKYSGNTEATDYFFEMTD